MVLSRPIYNICTARNIFGSGMFIPDPGSWFFPFPDPGSRIPDPKTATKERGEKKLVVITFYVATNFPKLLIILVWKCLRKKFGPFFKELQKFLPKKLSISSQKYGFGIRDPEKTYSGSRIPDPVVKKAPDPGSGSATLDLSMKKSASGILINPPIILTFPRQRWSSTTFSSYVALLVGRSNKRITSYQPTSFILQQYGTYSTTIAICPNSTIKVLSGHSNLEARLVPFDPATAAR
jgi:hypothetical protein